MSLPRPTDRPPSPQLQSLLRKAAAAVHRRPIDHDDLHLGTPPGCLPLYPSTPVRPLYPYPPPLEHPKGGSSPKLVMTKPVVLAAFCFLLSLAVGWLRQKPDRTSATPPPAGRPWTASGPSSGTSSAAASASPPARAVSWQRHGARQRHGAVAASVVSVVSVPSPVCQCVRPAAPVPSLTAAGHPCCTVVAAPSAVFTLFDGLPSAGPSGWPAAMPKSRPLVKPLVVPTLGAWSSPTSGQAPVRAATARRPPDAPRRAAKIAWHLAVLCSTAVRSTNACRLALLGLPSPPSWVVVQAANKSKDKPPRVSAPAALCLRLLLLLPFRALRLPATKIRTALPINATPLRNLRHRNGRCRGFRPWRGPARTSPPRRCSSRARAFHPRETRPTMSSPLPTSSAAGATLEDTLIQNVLEPDPARSWQTSGSCRCASMAHTAARQNRLHSSAARTCCGFPVTLHCLTLHCSDLSLLQLPVRRSSPEDDDYGDVSPFGIARAVEVVPAAVGADSRPAGLAGWPAGRVGGSVWYRPDSRCSGGGPSGEARRGGPSGLGGWVDSCNATGSMVAFGGLHGVLTSSAHGSTGQRFGELLQTTIRRGPADGLTDGVFVSTSHPQLRTARLTSGNGDEA